MADSTYEGLFLLDANKASADWDGVSGQVTGLIERHGGKIAFAAPWTEHRMAYPVGKVRKGSYLLTYFECPGPSIPQIEHDCRLNDSVLRQMILRLPTTIADQILQHINDPPSAEEQEEGGDGQDSRERRRGRDDG